jgi:diguanylate cyclase (GGDEF)-like protein/putative nucleotidyltransferase with HDIG domain
VLRDQSHLPVGSSYSTLSIGYAVSYLSLLVLGPGATSWVAMAGGWAQCSFNRKTKTPWYRTAFSMSSLVLAMEAAAQVLRLSGGSGPEASLDVLIRSVVASSLVYFFANTALIAIVMALQSRRSIFRVWDQDYLWSAPNYLIGAFAAAIAVRGFHAWGYASIVLLGLPLFLTYRLYTVYLSRVEDERRHVSELSTMHLATVEALALAIDAKDPTVKSHVQRVQLYAIALAKEIQAPDTVIDGVRVAALLHDVGKVGVPDHILTKTEPLTDDEVRKLRRHPELGAGIVGAVPFPYPVVPLIRSHHERWNGSGYPDGLRGEAIPLGARIIAIATRFESLRTPARANRVALGERDAIHMLQSEASTAFDPRLVDAFVAMLPAVEREIEMTGHARGSRPDTAWGGEPVATNVFEDIARTKQEQALLFESARADSLRDPLTNLPNRRFLTAHVGRELPRALRTNSELALVMIDLNDFKVINDRHGHQAGDDALRAVAQCLRTSLRPYDVCCRYGGDEFVMVLSGCTAEMVDRRSKEILDAVGRTEFDAGGNRVPLTFSIGVAMYPRDGVTYDELLRTADANMYAHKAASKVA